MPKKITPNLPKFVRRSQKLGLPIAISLWLDSRLGGLLISLDLHLQIQKNTNLKGL